jgi:hypothetical protein
MDFAKAMNRETTKKFTENQAMAFNSTGVSSILDLYATVGSMRSRIQDINPKFNVACEEDLLLATRLMFYTRDIRGGLGEREAFRTMLRSMSFEYPNVIRKNMELIPFFGRWDDLFVLIGTPVEEDMANLVGDQLSQDIINYNKKSQISLLAKWMPSINASSEKTIKMANYFRKRFSLTPREYRKILSVLRDHLNVLETMMSQKEWDKIRYNQVPSRAMNRYRKAFYRNDEDRFSQFIEQVKSGKTEIKAGTLYPYDIVEKYMNPSYSWYHGDRRISIDEVLEAQWKALPNYIEGNNNVIVMADVSGSMSGRPMATSVGLAIYFAERNSGPYRDLFMTFSGNPHFVKLQGKSLAEKIANAERADWSMNTNLEAAFMKVLEVAVENNVAVEDMPKAIVIISDMEIDYCASRSWSFYDEMTRRFARYGYTIPNIVFWNVNARHDTFLVDGNRKGVQLVSGQSVSTFKNVLSSIGKTPYQAMIDVLNGDRYSIVTV